MMTTDYRPSPLSPTRALLFVVLAALTAAAVAQSAPAGADPNVYVVTTTHDDDQFDDVSCSDPTEDQPCTLRAAIAAAGDGDQVQLGPGEHTLNEPLEINSAISIVGGGVNKTMVRPNTHGDHQILSVRDVSGTVSVTDISFGHGGDAKGDTHGRAISLSDSGGLTMSRVRFESNTADRLSVQPGGALSLARMSGPITLSSIEFLNNAAPSGGAIYLESITSNVIIHASKFTSNETDTEGGASVGGAIYAFDIAGMFEIRDSVLTGNDASHFGGALSLLDVENISIERTLFIGNSAADGGAIALRGNSGIEISNSTFIDNAGGAVTSNDTTNDATLSFVTLLNHTTGLEAADGEISVRSSVLANIGSCVNIAVNSLLRDSATDTNCAGTEYNSLALVEGIDGDLQFPGPASPILEHFTTDCPADDQRGQSRDNPCTFGSIQPAGVRCPSEPLPRDESIDCSLDVALIDDPNVVVRLNPTLLSDTVDLTRGAGSFAFVIPDDSPSTEVTIDVENGAYTSFLTAAHPTDQGGGTGGGGSEESGDGDSNESDDGSDTGGGSDTSDSDTVDVPEATSTGDSAPESIRSEEIAPAQPSTELPDQLAATGAAHRPLQAAGLTLISLGVVLVGTQHRRRFGTHRDR